ncbi:FAD-dependent monooxygenase [Streptomyces sp. FIT100]|uniref:FAD-dependent monooxygenase n=1 Tax=Streptomyces sp. FIT100 TaxID=2837956 RepID=UPI0021C92770|nr:FAD-dependent monooxygenase [Streptomyces sp. FIT100]UUN28479.1 FAD-dependent monooxygenase [Streptomyces sp. FIT100]
MTGKPSTDSAQSSDPTATPGSYDTDVTVVGAGPTGLLLAGDLATAGVRVTVVERRPEQTSNLTRAFGVHARTLELLDARDLADELVKTGSPMTRLTFFGRLALDLSRLRTRFPFLLVTPQYEVERLLKLRALAAGARFRYGTELHGLSQDAASVAARLSDEDGRESIVRSRYLVGTDGVRSSVRTTLGLPFPGGSVIRSMAMADVRLTEPPTSPLIADGTGDAFAVIASFGDGWYRAMAWRRSHQVPESEPVGLEEVREITRKAFGTDFGMRDPRWLSRFHSDERQVPEYRQGQIFLAGDAAHVHSPAGGQGMNTGMQDAANLSWKLTAALRGDTPDADALLDTYQSERHPVGKAVLRSSGAIVRLAMAHNRSQRLARSFAARFLSMVRPASDKAMGMISGIGIAYGAERGAHRLTGRRAPDLQLAEGRLYELLRGGEFVLITSNGEPPAAPAVPGRVTRAHWRTPRDTSLLIRPDGYIAWAQR